MTHIVLPGLAAASPARHAFCGRHRGTSSGRFESLNVCGRQGDAPGNVTENRATLAKAFGFLQSRLVTMHQVHGSEVEVVSRSRRASPPPEADALVTAETGHVLAVFTADCVPVVLAEMGGRAAAVVHAGWRGTAARIVEKTVETMTSRFACDPRRLVAGIGPSIGPCCYEIGDDAAEALRPAAPAPESFLLPEEPGRWRCNLARAVCHQLVRAGLALENIHDAGLCTRCRPDLFFSARRDGFGTGRQLSFVLLPDRAAAAGPPVLSGESKTSTETGKNT